MGIKKGKTSDGPRNGRGGTLDTKDPHGGRMGPKNGNDPHDGGPEDF